MTIGKILIADDEADIRLIVSLSARKLGRWEVVQAGSGAEAFRRAREEKPDVILLDVMMPDGDGPATLAKLRDDPATAGIPVIFLTAKVQKRELGRYLELGAAGVIRKPLDVLKLPDEVRRIVEGGDDV